MGALRFRLLQEVHERTPFALDLRTAALVVAAQLVEIPFVARKRQVICIEHVSAPIALPLIEQVAGCVVAFVSRLESSGARYWKWKTFACLKTNIIIPER